MAYDGVFCLRRSVCKRTGPVGTTGSVRRGVRGRGKNLLSHSPTLPSKRDRLLHIGPTGELEKDVFEAADIALHQLPEFVFGP